MRRLRLVATGLAAALSAALAGPAAADDTVTLNPGKEADTVANQPRPVPGGPIEDFDRAGEYAGLTKLLAASQTVTGQPIKWGGKPTTLEMYRIVVPPGAKSGLHKHNVPFIGYLKQGKIRVTNDELGSFTVEAGETITEVMGVYQRGKNIGDEPAVIYGVYLTDAQRDISELHPDAESYAD